MRPSRRKLFKLREKLTLYLFAGIILFTGILFVYTAHAENAVAMLSGTAEGSVLTAEVSLQDTETGLLIEASFKNAPPGKHGFHIHQFGSCSDSGKAAGG